MMKDYSYEIQQIRKDFPFFKTSHGQELIYMDNAATTLKPQAVLDEWLAYNIEFPANIHRAVYDISQKASDKYEKAREFVAEFLGASTPNEIIFTNGTTAGINHFSRSFAEAFLNEGDSIVITEMEHHANLLPWQKIAKDYKIELKIIPLKDDGTLDLSEIDDLLKGAKLLAMTAISNTLGTINPIEILCKKAKSLGVVTFVDAAQSIAHQAYDLQNSDIDFLVFSGHKVFAPTGVGVLYGKKEILKQMPPFFLGGGIVYDVSLKSAIFGTGAAKFEAGTPPIGEVIALAEALKYLQNIGWDTVHGIDTQHLALGLEMFDRLKEYYFLYGNEKERSPIFSYKCNEVHPHDVGSFMNEYKIAVRTGHQCTQTIWKKYAVSSVTRLSSGLYNLPQEWEKIEVAMKSLLEFFHVGKFS